MHRRPRWLRIGARIGKRIDVIQILHSARQRHLAGPLYLDRNGRLLSDRVFFSTIQRRQHTGLFRVARVLFLLSHSHFIHVFSFSFLLSLFYRTARPLYANARTSSSYRRFIFIRVAGYNQPRKRTLLSFLLSLTRCLHRSRQPSVPFSPCLFLPPHVPFASTGSTTKQRLTWIPWSRWTDILFLYSDHFSSVREFVLWEQEREREKKRGTPRAAVESCRFIFVWATMEIRDGGKSAAILSLQLFALFHRSIGLKWVSGKWVFNGNVNIIDITMEILTRKI